jgi:hypothetical protein
VPALAQRALLAFVVLVVGWLALPLSATLLDGVLEGGLLVVALLLAALVGGAAGALLPGVVGPDSPRWRSALLGAALGMAATVISTIALFVIISG